MKIAVDEIDEIALTVADKPPQFSEPRTSAAEPMSLKGADRKAEELRSFVLIKCRSIPNSSMKQSKEINVRNGARMSPTKLEVKLGTVVFVREP